MLQKCSNGEKLHWEWCAFSVLRNQRGAEWINIHKNKRQSNTGKDTFHDSHVQYNNLLQLVVVPCLFPCPYFIEPCLEGQLIFAAPCPLKVLGSALVAPNQWKWNMASFMAKTLWDLEMMLMLLAGPVFVPLSGDCLDGHWYLGRDYGKPFVYIFSCTNLNIKELNIIVLYSQKIWNI